VLHPEQDRLERADQADLPLVDWPTSVAFAVGAAIAAIALILLFSYIVDWIGELWPQVLGFALILGGIAWLAERDRRKDERDPARRRRGASITRAGLPGPFVFTQAVGVLGVSMIAVGAILTWILDDPRGLLWFGGGWVLVLVGAVGLVFWVSGLRTRGTARSATA
jgi:amino acid transporter